jgi:hypothetical protein
MTFLPAWPVAVPAARRHQRPGNLGIDLVCVLVAFAVYFWLAGGLLLGRGALGR